ncbi:MAG: response regulator [Gammaproteobacteria bacterium]|nr:response regulator [Gammaproteobacteria bacterium]
MSAQTTVLVVDDLPDNIHLVSDILKRDYRVLATTNGQQAIDILAEQDVDVILLDVMMPGMNGFEVCQSIKQDQRLANIPVVFLTALEDQDDIRKGLELGAYYYLTKPVKPSHLQAVVAAAIESFSSIKSLHKESKNLQSCITLLQQAQFDFRTLKEARNLGTFVAKAFPEPEKSVLGLTELLVNAVEHGNLGITYQDKSELTEQGLWEQEVERRLQLDEYRHRKASLTIEQDEQGIRALISDQGAGFDWQPYLNIDLTRIFDTHGRGIAMAKGLSFDLVEFLGNGSQVQVTVFKKPVQQS